MKKQIIRVLAILIAFLLSVVVIHSIRHSEYLRQTEIQANPYYVSFLPLVKEPKLNMKTRQWEFVFSINGNTNEQKSYRKAFYPGNQGISSAPGLIEDQMYRIKAGDEIEIQEVLDVMPEVSVSHTYFVLSLRRKYD